MHEPQSHGYSIQADITQRNSVPILLYLCIALLDRNLFLRYIFSDILLQFISRKYALCGPNVTLI